MRKLKWGFTLVELIVVIAVIGILATVTILGLGRYQADTRDAQRASGVAVIAEALEKYYDQNGEYPGCLAVEASAPTVASNTLKGIDQSVLRAPQAPSNQTNSVECIGDPELTISGDDFYQFVGDGSEACRNGSSCLAFTLRYKDEVNGEIKEIKSRRTTQIATSGDITLSGSALDSVSVSLSWTAIANATDYTVQRADDAGFTTNASSTSSTTNSAIVGGLSRGNTYYFRVQANGAGTQSNWSNVISVTTLDLNGPIITSTSSTTTSITVNWQTLVGATSYRMEYATKSDFSDKITITGIATLTRTVNSLPVGTQYYVKVYGVNGVTIGDPSDVAMVNTTIAAPSAPTMNNPSNIDNSTSYSTTWTWGPTGSCPTGTTMQYRNQYGYNSSGPYLSAWSSAGTTTTRTVTTSQGYTYTVYAQARCISSTWPSIYSDWSSSATKAFFQAVTAPTNISFSASRGGSNTIYMNASATCRTGATRYGHFDEYSGSLMWTNGPNTGNYGWYTPGGWRVTNTTSFSGGAVNSYAIPNGAQYLFRIWVQCRNLTTNATAGGSEHQSGWWVWGSNV